MKLQITNRKSQINQRGYMMITLMLALALITIAMLAVLPDIKEQVKRDREEELMHRGTAYMRAIQHYYKKLGRYPSRLEDLENTNNMRFVRKRYTDPVNRDPATGKERDFKLLHQQDITLNNGPVLGPTAGQLGQSGTGQGAFGGGQSGFGGAQSGFGGGQGGLGGAQGGFGSAQGGAAGFGAQSGGLQNTGANAQTGSPDSGTAGSGTGSTSSSGSTSDTQGNSSATGSSSNSGATSASGPGLSGQTFGGGPILGVASLSKETTIRVFFDKNHYNDWLFIYTPTADRGGLLTGPVNPNAQASSLGGLNPAQAAGALGQQSGQAQGFGQGLNSNTNNGQGQAPPSAPPVVPGAGNTPPPQ